MANVLLKTIETHRVDSEEEAINMIERSKEMQLKEGYTLTKSGYTMRSKKSKGEVIELWYIVTIEKSFD